MKGKRFISLTLCCLLLPAWALAQVEELSGSVVAGYQTSVTAPFGGEVSAVHMREGEWVEPGDALVTVRTTKVFSPIDGTVSGALYAQGDTVDGAVLNVAPVSRYTITATVTDQYGQENPASRYIELGETVYMRCQKDRSHVAVGRVIAASGTDYTVEATGGELYLEETVNIYRDGGYTFASLIGTGTVARAASVEVAGSGSLLRLHVTNGDTVERGQLLFETVEGSLDGYTGNSSTIAADSAGVVSAVALQVGSRLQKGESVALLYPREGFQLAVVVPEDMIGLVKQGDTLRFYLDWDEENPRWYEGAVTSLSYISTMTTESTTTFTAYMDFDADESVRLGMTAVVEIDVP